MSATKDELREFCQDLYVKTRDQEYLIELDGKTSESAKKSATLAAQRKAIDEVFVGALLKYSSEFNEDEIWQEISEIHKVSVADLSDFDIPDDLQPKVIDRCVSAHQSWIKSSGHAFERYVSYVTSDILQKNEIQFVLQTELRKLINKKKLKNTEDDIKNLKSWGKDFDLYAIQYVHGEAHVFGCIQSKTSIRDRVGRDLAFSKNAMNGLFWSAAVVLDGGFLNMPEFIHMVNGGGSYGDNGWHGMYVMSEIDNDCGRIYKADDKLTLFAEHAVEAAKQFISDRRLLNKDWKAM